MDTYHHLMSFLYGLIARYSIMITESNINHYHSTLFNPSRKNNIIHFLITTDKYIFLGFHIYSLLDIILFMYDPTLNVNIYLRRTMNN